MLCHRTYDNVCQSIAIYMYKAVNRQACVCACISMNRVYFLRNFFSYQNYYFRSYTEYCCRYDLPIEQAQIIRMSVLLICRCHCSSRCCSIRFDSDKFVSLCVPSDALHPNMFIHEFHFISFEFSLSISLFRLRYATLAIGFKQRENEKTTIQFASRRIASQHRRRD